MAAKLIFSRDKRLSEYQAHRPKTSVKLRSEASCPESKVAMTMRGDYAKRKKLYAPVDIPRGDVQRNQRRCPSTGRKKRGCQANKLMM